MKLSPKDTDLITAHFGVQSRGSSDAARRIEAAGLRKQRENEAKRINEKPLEVKTLPQISPMKEITETRPQMIEPKERELPERSRTSSGLRDILFDAINEVRQGKMSADQAKAVGELTKQLLSSVRLEIEASKARKEIEGDVGVLQLGDQR